uniref:TFIIS N-terminal domain-containing protein n=1 Tax=Setaria italica TaxID=4555 RepID=K3YLJ0_SETIT
MALRRLKPLLGAFEHIDAAIEAAAGADGCRDEFRRARARIIEMVCDAAAADDGAGDEKAEGLCALLDEAMAGSLATLLAVPAEKTELVSGGLVGAVDALMREHPSERVRGLAGDVVRGWRAGAKIEIARARAKLDALPSTPPPPPPHDDTAPAAGSDTTAKKIPEEQPRSRPRKSAVVSSSSRRISTAESYAPLSTKKSAPIVVATSSAKPSANMGAPTAVPAKPKKTPLVVVSTSSAKPSVSMGAPSFVPAQPKKTPLVIVRSTAEEKKLEVTKRKLHERYQEAEDAKRRRTIQVIKPPRPPPATTGQRQRIVHSGVRARGPASCASERIFNKSCSLRMRI